MLQLITTENESLTRVQHRLAGRGKRRIRDDKILIAGCGILRRERDLQILKYGMGEGFKTDGGIWDER